LYELIDLVIHL